MARSGQTKVPSAAKPLEDLTSANRRTTAGRQVEVVIEKKKPWRERPKAAPVKETRRATVEEVEDEDELPAQPATEPPLVNNPVAKELPYKDVPPVVFAKRPDVPIRPVDRPAVGPSQKKDRNYELRAPVEGTDSDNEDEELLDDIFTDLAYHLPLGKLLRISPKIREKIRRRLTKTRVPVHKNFEQLGEMEEEILPLGMAESLSQNYVQADAISTRELPYSAQFYVTEKAEGLVPKGAMIMSDPVLQYLASIPAGEEPKQVFVAYEDVKHVGGDSAALRVLYPLIHGVAEKESICDGGSQIVSMSQVTAIELGIGWDPDICIYMQSANGQVEKSLGLSKNVSFLFGEVTVYLQVHVIKQPAYKVLLGRPFEVLTGSTIQNSTDGSQLITLTDPNTQKRHVVPTFERGAVRQLKKMRDSSTGIPEEPAVEVKFQNSMN